jgi:hypothetical protein
MRITYGLLMLATTLPLMQCFDVAAQNPNPEVLELSVTKPDPPAPLSWTTYVGLEAKSREWMQTIRIPGRPDIAESPAAVSAMVAMIKPLFAQKRALIVPIGGLVSARFPDRVSAYLKKIEQDQGKAWKERVYRQALAVAKVAPSHHHYALQVGNEINSRHYTETIGLWRGNPPQAKYIQNDETIIPIYVEYYLAPTVEAIRKASRAAYKDDNRMQIMLGSLANANNERSQEWLEALLSHRVKGKYAPTLAGQSVHQLVNLISTHYLVTADDQDWRTKLNTLWSRWVGQGRVRGVWATEELGKQRALQNRGAETALKVTARYLSWWGSRQLRPEQSRFSFWGWDLGATNTRGEDGMKALHQCLGNAPLRSLMLQDPAQLKSSSLEAYLFETARSPGKKALFLFPTVNLDKLGRRNRQRNYTQAHIPEALSSAIRISQNPNKPNRRRENAGADRLTIPLPKSIRLNGTGWTAALKTKLQLFSTEGVATRPIPTTTQNGDYQLEIPQGMSLSQQNVALFCLTQSL